MTVKAMEHTITQADSNCTLATGTAALMTDIATYKTPRHTAIQLRPEDVLSAYLKDAGAEMAATDVYELVVRDPNQLSTEVISAGIYTTIKEFQDRNKTKKLGLSKLVRSDYFIVLRAKATTVLVVASCYWQITCLRFAQTL
jgi:hypothetical protein